MLEVSQETIDKNLTRWKREQEVKHEKRAKLTALAVSMLKAKLDREPRPHEVRAQVRYILAERKAKYLLKNCRATIGEIIKAHPPKQGA